MPNKTNNPCNRQNFTLAIEVLKYHAPWNRYAIEDIYLDLGAGMKWETIVCYRSVNDSYQMLCPRDWDILNIAATASEITLLMEKIVSDQAKLLRC